MAVDYNPDLAKYPEFGTISIVRKIGKLLFQRNFRDFSYTSGRCPRLPDKSGLVETDERTQYNSLFPLVHAEQGEDNDLRLTLYLPNQARGKRVYYSNTWKRWWVRIRANGWTQRRFLKIENFMQNSQSILDYMAFRNSDHCIFRCEIEDNWF